MRVWCVLCVLRLALLVRVVWPHQYASPRELQMEGADSLTSEMHRAALSYEQNDVSIDQFGRKTYLCRLCDREFTHAPAYVQHKRKHEFNINSPSPPAQSKHAAAHVRHVSVKPKLKPATARMLEGSVHRDQYAHYNVPVKTSKPARSAKSAKKPRSATRPRSQSLASQEITGSNNTSMKDISARISPSLSPTSMSSSSLQSPPGPEGTRAHLASGTKEPARKTLSGPLEHVGLCRENLAQLDAAANSGDQRTAVPGLLDRRAAANPASKAASRSDNCPATATAPAVKTPPQNERHASNITRAKEAGLVKQEAPQGALVEKGAPTGKPAQAMSKENTQRRSSSSSSLNHILQASRFLEHMGDDHANDRGTRDKTDKSAALDANLLLSMLAPSHVSEAAQKEAASPQPAAGQGKVPCTALPKAAGQRKRCASDLNAGPDDSQDAKGHTLAAEHLCEVTAEGSEPTTNHNSRGCATETPERVSEATALPKKGALPLGKQAPAAAANNCACTGSWFRPCALDAASRLYLATQWKQTPAQAVKSGVLNSFYVVPDERALPESSTDLIEIFWPYIRIGQAFQVWFDSELLHHLLPATVEEVRGPSTPEATPLLSYDKTAVRLKVVSERTKDFCYVSLETAYWDHERKKKVCFDCRSHGNCACGQNDLLQLPLKKNLLVHDGSSRLIGLNMVIPRERMNGRDNRWLSKLTSGTVKLMAVTVKVSALNVLEKDCSLGDHVTKHVEGFVRIAGKNAGLNKKEASTPLAICSDCQLPARHPTDCSWCPSPNGGASAAKRAASCDVTPEKPSKHLK